jgi:hypothetical protein
MIENKSTTIHIDSRKSRDDGISGHTPHPSIDSIMRDTEQTLALNQDRSQKNEKSLSMGKRIAALTVGSLVVLGGYNALTSDSDGTPADNVVNAEEVVVPAEEVVPTTLVTIHEGGSVWSSAEEELKASGYSRKDGSLTDEMVTDVQDTSLELNKAANPSFDPGDIQIGQQIILENVPQRSEK